ncbi:hypothetical protein OOT46_03935 [Aquabacterium sp. A7-Y]|uniref:T6SS effector BTH_I2691 family protein n=1 Tax=Aquabacterium sp. A7-Y TaxID=1349605 RepID=UPI00223DEF49|nr:T6SS effector BTH_I2691 family protein [Aquabacterium sp. A7-Y]MCW7537004.1 hypothetical protein [Aquabacterium sp. A7-Y]
MTATAAQGCDTCNKSSLSLLLLRPSPIALRDKLAPVGSSAVESDEAVMSGLLPQRLPTESRFVLRLLRAGYVHVYIPAPPPGVKNWLVFRVTSDADLVPEGNAYFGAPDTSIACKRTDKHNVMGMKLLNIPQAHRISDLWIAYSANLWNDTLRHRNKANPRAMQQVSLGGGSNNTFQPTVSQLRSKVLEAALTRSSIGVDYRFISVADRVENLAEQLTRAAACHPKTKGKELALVLRDPAAIATELNTLRLRRHELAGLEVKKPEYEHELKSSEALMTLKEVILDGNLVQAQERRAKEEPIVSKQKFDAMPKFDPYSNTDVPRRWEPLEDTKENREKYGVGMGRVVSPGREKQLREEAEEAARVTWAKMEKDYYDESARVEWLASFEKMMKDKHYDPVARYEADWWSARQDSEFCNYFALHFDENDPNEPKQRHSPGAVYAAEVSRALTPAPFCDGMPLTGYLDELSRSPTQPDALMWRALVCNQAAVLPQLAAVADTDLSVASAFVKPKEELHKKVGQEQDLVAYLKEDRYDKVFDLGKGLITLSAEAKNPNAIQKAIVKYSWLSRGLGDIVGAFGLPIANSFVAAAALLATVRGVQASPATQALIQRAFNRALSSQLGQRMVDQALKTLMAGTRLNVPVLISVEYPVHMADHRLAQMRGGFSRQQVENARSSGNTVTVHLLIDSEDLAKYAGDVDDAIVQGAGKVTLPANAPGVLLQPPPGSGRLPVSLSRTQFERAWHRRNELLKLARAAASNALVIDGQRMASTVDGRLALGTVAIAAAGFGKSVCSLSNVKPGEERDWLGFMDASAGLIAAGFELVGFAMTKRLEAAGGIAADSSKLAGMRAIGSFLGAVGGVLGGISAMKKADKAKQAGQSDVMRLYVGSAVMFYGTAVTGTMSVAGAVAETLLKAQARGALSNFFVRRIGQQALQGIATRVGVGGVLALAGVSIPGLGWILLGVGIGFEVFAVMRTPTPLQVWVSRTRFGKSRGTDSESKKFDDWKAEHQALKKLFEPEEKTC